MEKKLKLQIYCLWAASLLIGLFGAVCLFLGISGEYDNAMGYFKTESIFAPVVYCCLVAGPVLGIVGWIVFRRYQAPDACLPGGIISVAVFALAAVSILCSTVVEAIPYVNAAPGSVHGATVVSWILSVLAAVGLIAGGVASKPGMPVKPLVSLLSFAGVLYCASRVLLMYFDQSVAVNSPIKFICQLGYLSYMLVFCSETGLSLGKGNIFPRYIFTLCAAVAIGGTSAIASVAVTVSDAQCDAIAGAECIAKLGLFIYAVVRLLLAARIEAKYVEKAPKTSEKEKGAEDEAEDDFDSIFTKEAEADILKITENEEE